MGAGSAAGKPATNGHDGGLVWDGGVDDRGLGAGVEDLLSRSSAPDDDRDLSAGVEDLLSRSSARGAAGSIENGLGGADDLRPSWACTGALTSRCGVVDTFESGTADGLNFGATDIVPSGSSGLNVSP